MVSRVRSEVNDVGQMLTAFPTDHGTTVINTLLQALLQAPDFETPAVRFVSQVSLTRCSLTRLFTATLVSFCTICELG